MGDVAWAYEAIIASEQLQSWMVLHYETSTGTVQDELRLLSSGSGGLADMKHKMAVAGLDRVYVAFYREQEDESRKRRCILINYLPVGLSSIRRARAMVHSRRLSATLLAAQTTLTLDHIANLTSSAIFKALANPESNHVITTETQSTDGDPLPEAPSTPSHIPLPTSSYPTYSSTPTSSGNHQKSSSMFSGLLKKRVKPPQYIEEPVIINQEDLLPPPPPPKDPNKRPSMLNTTQSYTPDQSSHARSPSVDTFVTSKPPSPMRDRSQSLSEFAVISHHPNGSGQLTVHDESSTRPIPGAMHKSYTLPAAMRSNFVLPLPDKWSSTPVTTSTSPEARARMRAEARAEREREEQRALDEEKVRQGRLKALRDQADEEAMLEEQRRKGEIEIEVRRAAAVRRQKQDREDEEEQRRKEEIRLKKEAERQRREAEHKRLEQWRKAKENEILQQKRREEQDIESSVAALRREVMTVSSEIKECVRRGDRVREREFFCGEVSLQKTGGDSLLWRRRYWKVVGQVMLLCKNSKDTNLILHSVDIRNDVRAIKEWHEGYEELKAIPHSFALEFKDRNKDTWSLYADSEADKIRILALFNFLGGL